MTIWEGQGDYLRGDRDDYLEGGRGDYLIGAGLTI